jgi:hypothetical protein
MRPALGGALHSRRCPGAIDSAFHDVQAVGKRIAVLEREPRARGDRQGRRDGALAGHLDEDRLLRRLIAGGRQRGDAQIPRRIAGEGAELGAHRGRGLAPGVVVPVVLRGVDVLIADQRLLAGDAPLDHVAGDGPGEAGDERDRGERERSTREGKCRHSRVRGPVGAAPLAGDGRFPRVARRFVTVADRVPKGKARIIRA